MFRNTFQSGFLSVLYSIGSKPLQIWDKKVRNGHIKRITDQDIQSSVLEIMGTNVSTNFITCPADPKKPHKVFRTDQHKDYVKATAGTPGPNSNPTQAHGHILRPWPRP